MVRMTLKGLDKDRLYLVALSGGPDSVALLRMMHDGGYHVEAAHCNFRLRGAESDRDEAFCKELCEQTGTKLHLAHFDTKAFAELRGISIEMAARELRYQWFTHLAEDIGAEGVCIAHHSDDQVETILLNMLRGTGLKGLLGMRRKNGLFLRPLLGISRKEILDYLDAIGQNYVTDSTNLEDDVQRNQLRLDIIPLLEQVTPAAKQNILRMADNLSDVEAIVNESLEEALKGCKVACRCGKAYSLKRIKAYASPRLLLWTIVSAAGFNREQATEMLGAEEGGRLWTSQQAVAVISNHTLFVYDRAAWEAPQPTLRLPETGLYSLNDGKLRVAVADADTYGQPSKERFVATLDANRATFPLTLRPVRAGDRFTPFGMNGSKLVSDYLKDRKVEPLERHRQLVVTNGTGQIVWLVGRTIDERFKITENTEKVMEIKKSSL